MGLCQRGCAQQGTGLRSPCTSFTCLSRTTSEIPPTRWCYRKDEGFLGQHSCGMMRGQSPPAQQTSPSAPTGSDLTGFFLRDSEVLSCSMEVTLVWGSWAARVELRLHGLLPRCAAATPRLPGPERHRAAGTRCAPPGPAGAPLSPQTPAAPPRFTRGARLLQKTPPFPPGRAEQKAAPRPEGRRGPLPSAAEQPCPALPRPAHPRTARAGRRPQASPPWRRV